MFSATCPYLRPSLNRTVFQFKWDCLIMFLSSLFLGFSFVFPILGLPGDLLAAIAISKLCQCCQWPVLNQEKWLVWALWAKSRKYLKSHKLLLKELDIQPVTSILQPFISINQRHYARAKNNGVLTQPFTVLKSYLIYFRIQHILLPLVFTLEPRSPHH